jgi:S-adenosylmethionine decarboxylase
MHLLIDGYGGERDRMWNSELVRHFLETYPTKLGMTRMSEAQISTWEAPDPGLSGFVVIAESHICIHTFPIRDYVNVDIFSCKSFDSQLALQDVISLFSLKTVNHWILERGLEFANSDPPKPVQRTTHCEPASPRG